MNEIIKILNQTDGGIVLDAATGRGEFITTLKQHLKSYIQIVGIDASERIVDYTQKLFPENDVEIFRMNLEHIQFTDAYFDLVCMSNSLHHLEHKENVITELMRVLKPGGMLLITEMYHDGNQTPAQQTHILLHHWLAGVDRLMGSYHQSTYSRQELKDMFHKVPLQAMEIADFYIPVDDPIRNCDSLLRNCRETLKRLENLPESIELVNEGSELIRRIKDIGCASASRLLMYGRKEK